MTSLRKACTPYSLPYISPPTFDHSIFIKSNAQKTQVSTFFRHLGQFALPQG